jgi:hypothetical protein
MNPSFDLEKSIAAWRAEMTASDPLRTAGLDEIETHLRDGFAELRARGLADGEAFHLARGRVGGAEIVEEFAKVHPDAVWAERGKWMLFGVLSFAVFWSALGLLGSLLDVAIKLCVSRTGYIMESWAILLGTPLVFGVALFRLVRGKWRLGRLGRLAAGRHASVLAVFVGLMLLVEKVVDAKRMALLLHELQNYGFGATYATLRSFDVIPPLATLVCVIVVSALANRWSRRPA